MEKELEALRAVKLGTVLCLACSIDYLTRDSQNHIVMVNFTICLLYFKKKLRCKMWHYCLMGTVSVLDSRTVLEIDIMVAQYCIFNATELYI